MPIATVIAADTLNSGQILDAQEILRDAGCNVKENRWLDEGKAADIFFDGDLPVAKNALSSLNDRHDICVQDDAHRRKMLLVSDMDSTMITVECIDELADYAGIKAQVAEVTERAMQGELDFAEALHARVALLKGLNVGAIARCLNERVKIMPGAKILVQSMAAWGAHCILVSGGFTHFTNAVSAQIGFHMDVANMLGVDGDNLTGMVDGEIVDANRKQQLLEEYRAIKSLNDEQVLAVGDGANDIPMIHAAGLGAAYHAKEKAVAASDFAIRHNDLTALLYAQGIARKDWVVAR